MDPERFARLANILNDVSVLPRFDRIQRLAGEITDRSGCEPDELDGVTLRLLLDEYTNAVAHFRAAVRECNTGVDRVPSALRHVRRHLHS